MQAYLTIVFALLLLKLGTQAQIPKGIEPLRGIPSPIAKFFPESDNAWIVVTQNGEHHTNSVLGGEYTWLDPTTSDSVHCMDGVVRDHKGDLRGSFRVIVNNKQLQLTDVDGSIRIVQLPDWALTYVTVGCVTLFNDTILVGPKMLNRSTGLIWPKDGIALSVNNGQSWTEFPRTVSESNICLRSVTDVFVLPNDTIVALTACALFKMPLNGVSWQLAASMNEGQRVGDFVYGFDGNRAIRWNFNTSENSIVYESPDWAVQHVRVRNLDTIAVVTQNVESSEWVNTLVGPNDVVISSDTLTGAENGFLTAEFNSGKQSICAVTTVQEQIEVKDATLKTFATITFLTPTYSAIEIEHSADGVNVRVPTGIYSPRNTDYLVNAKYSVPDIRKMFSSSEIYPLTLEREKDFLVDNGLGFDTISRVNLSDEAWKRAYVYVVGQSSDSAYISTGRGMAVIKLGEPRLPLWRNEGLQGFPLSPGSQDTGYCNSKYLYLYNDEVIAIANCSDEGIWRYHQGAWMPSVDPAFDPADDMNVNRIENKLVLQRITYFQNGQWTNAKVYYFIYDIETSELTAFPQEDTIVNISEAPFTLLSSGEIITIINNPGAPDEIVALNPSGTVRALAVFDEVVDILATSNKLYVGTERFGFFTIDVNPTAGESSTPPSAISQTRVSAKYFRDGVNQTIQIPLTNNETISDVSATSITGERTTIQYNGAIIDIATLINGWYHLRVETDIRTVHVEVLIVR